MPLRPEGMDTEGMTQIADKLRAQGDDEAAANFYERALQRAPYDNAARQALIAILEAHGDEQNALSQYQAGLQIDPDNSEWLRGYGRLLLKLGQAEAAKEQYEKALALDSDDIKALNGLGVALDYLGDHERAQKVYRDALDDDSDNMSTLSNLGHSYVLSGSYEAAIRLLEPYVGNKNATPVLRQNLAEAYGLLGMEVDAERMERMDLNEAEIKKNRTFYQTQRTKLALVPKFYADLGSFPTEDIAEVKKNMAAHIVGVESEKLKIIVKSGVSVSGGTPHFNVLVSGFSNSYQLHNFCELIKKAEFSCSEHRT